MLGEDKETASGKFRNAIDRAKAERAEARTSERDAPAGSEPGRGRRGFSLQPDEWELVEEIHDEAEGAVTRARLGDARSPTRGDAPRRARPQGGTGSRAGRDAAVDDIEGTVRAELARSGGPRNVERLEQRLRDATRAFEAERYSDASRVLKRLAEDAPSAASVRELFGLTLYRLGRWRAAAHELEAFRLLADSTEQHPVLADCYRALGRYAKVDELWAELRAASPGAAIVTEGRIVTAGSLADRGDLARAIEVLEQGWTFPKRAKDHHLRRAYALADCYERAGDVVRARELFGRIRAADPGFADVARRVRALA